MADAAPTQSLIVRLPADKARQVVGIVDNPASAYSSVDEFIRLAVENQLTLDDPHLGVDPRSRQAVSSRVSQPGSDTLTGSSAPVEMPVKPVPGEPTERLLLRPEVGGIPLREPTKGRGEPLSSFTNRLTPLLAGPRALANLSHSGEAPLTDAYLDLTAKVARVFGARLRAEDEAAGRRGRHRRSTAWPIGDDESKSLIRYRNCFMFTPEPKGSSGPLIDLGLVTVVDGRAYLTDSGASFAGAPVPAVDDDEGVELLSADHRKILSIALAAIPGERLEIQQFLDAVDRTDGLQDEVDKELTANHREWSEAQVVSHRAALVGRLRDIKVIDVEALPSAKSRIIPGPEFEQFQSLLRTKGTGGWTQ